MQGEKVMKHQSNQEPGRARSTAEEEQRDGQFDDERAENRGPPRPLTIGNPGHHLSQFMVHRNRTTDCGIEKVFVELVKHRVEIHQHQLGDDQRPGLLKSDAHNRPEQLFLRGTTWSPRPPDSRSGSGEDRGTKRPMHEHLKENVVGHSRQPAKPVGQTRCQEAQQDSRRAGEKK